MELTGAEKAIIDRYHEKTRIAGGPRKGYVLRQRAICYEAEDEDRCAAGLEGLVGKGLLRPSEDRRFYFLTEAGVELLNGWR